MSDLSVFIKALGFGLAVAAPVGPMSLLCMRTTLTRGWRGGLAIGSGIATADGLYGLVAALGLAGISTFMLAHEQPLHLAAGLFLIWLGLRKLFARGGESAEATKQVAGRGWRRDFATSVLLTLTNPPTIIMFAAVFAAIAPAGQFSTVTALWTVGGVFLGSMLWWCAVVVAVSIFRHAIGVRARLWIERVAGLVLAAFGVVEVRRGISG